MTDVLTPTQRRFNMSRIRSKNTGPELAVRRVVHAMGYRYRLHVRDIPGRPDLVFPRLRKIIFVHGCFWHMHSCPRGLVQPKTNAAFWDLKRRGNVARDRSIVRTLRRAGWSILTVWECEVRRPDRLERRLRRFLSSHSTPSM